VLAHQPLQKLVQIRRLRHHLVLTGKVQQVPHNNFAAVGLADDHLEIVPVSVAFGSLFVDDVGVEQDGRQGIVQLVGHTRSQLAHRGQLLLLEQLLLSLLERVGHVVQRAHQLGLRVLQRPGHGVE